MRGQVGRGSAAVAAIALVAHGASSEGDARLTGLWTLLSYAVEVQADGRMIPVMGEHPTGYADFTPENRVFFTPTGEGRKPATDAAGAAALLDTLVSHAGRFTVDGDRWTAELDTAWNPAWVGTERTRTFQRDGTRLRVPTPWRVMPNWAEQGTTRGIVTFERAADG